MAAWTGTSEVFTIKSIKPAKLNVDAIRMEILNELRKEGTVHRKTLKKTVATWEGDKPEFESQIGLERPPGSASVLTGPTGSEKGVSKWRWLNEGTQVRYALMSKDWRSKTKPGRYRSGPGRGKMLFVSRKLARPGIKARGWTPKLMKARRKPYTQRMIKATQRGAGKAFPR